MWIADPATHCRQALQNVTTSEMLVEYLLLRKLLRTLCLVFLNRRPDLMKAGFPDLDVMSPTATYHLLPAIIDGHSSAIDISSVSDR